MKLLQQEPVITIEHDTDIEVIVVNERINKKYLNPVVQLQLMSDENKENVIIRLHLLKKLKKHGRDHLLDMIRECYASRKRVYVSEASKEVTVELGHAGIRYYEDFDAAYEAAVVS